MLQLSNDWFKTITSNNKMVKKMELETQPIDVNDDDKTTLYQFETSHGIAKWSQDLKPRQRSGFVGQMTVNCQFTIDELAQIQKKLPEATSKRRLQDSVKKHFGIVLSQQPKPATATADTTKTTEMWITGFREALQKVCEQRQKNGQKLPTAENVYDQIKKVVPQQQQNDVLKALVSPDAYTRLTSSSMDLQNLFL